MYGVLDEDDRALDVAELIQDFSHLLPDLIMHASGHDTGSILFSPDMRRQAERLVVRGQRKGTLASLNVERPKTPAFCPFVRFQPRECYLL